MQSSTFIFNLVHSTVLGLFDIFVVLLGSVLHVNYISKDKFLHFNQFQQNMHYFSNTAHLCNILHSNMT